MTDRWFKHYKGGVYKLIDADVRLESTGVPMVVYEGKDGLRWVRPLKEFQGKFDEIKEPTPNDGWFKKQADLANQSINERPSWIRDSFRETKQ